MPFDKESRPWGVFYTLYHPDLCDKSELAEFTARGDCAIKMLHIEPNQRTSLQYHSSRAEFLIVTGGSGRIYMPDDDRDGDIAVYDVVAGMCVIIRRRERHRIEAKEQGLDIAEVWLRRVGPEAPGRLEESDVVRLEDDYGRIK